MTSVTVIIIANNGKRLRERSLINPFGGSARPLCLDGQLSKATGEKRCRTKSRNGIPGRRTADWSTYRRAVLYCRRIDARAAQSCELSPRRGSG